MRDGGTRRIFPRRRGRLRRRTVALLSLATVAASPSPSVAQSTDGTPQERDTVPAVTLDELVVVGSRAETELGASVAGVTRLDAAELASVPVASVAEALRMVPGVALLDFDGTGFDPQLVMRGFYGGGEAEYVKVLLDGRPLNDLHTGLIAWDLVPPVAVRSVEVVRGGASALWGDAALGGVVNVVTEDDGDEGRLAWELEGGELGAVQGGVRLSGPVGSRSGSVFATGRRQDGYRDHAEGAAVTVGGEIDLLELGSGDGADLTVSGTSAWREIERPGALASQALEEDRRESHPFYRFDRTKEWVHRVALDGRTDGGWNASLAGELRRGDDVRTLPLAPEFADTKARDLAVDRLLGSVRHESSGLGLTPGDRLVVGIDADLGRLDSEHYAVVAGPPGAYEAASGERGDLDARGEGSRRSAALFVQYDVTPVEALRLSLGGRVDWLRDRYEPGAVPGGEGPGEPTTRSHRAFSPKVGANLRYVGSSRNRGHVYLAAGRSFKAPTLDQLFDQRSIPVPFPPFSATTSNPDLEPQQGTQVEAGVYHSSALSSGVTAGLNASVYRMDMEDELDFDVASLRYVNIGRSRHDGLEIGVDVAAPRATRLFVSWALQHATQRRGENEGRRLKAIPEHFLAAGLSTGVGSGVRAGLFVTRASGAWLDDANTLPLDAYTRVDARVSWEVAGRTLYLDARNVFDRSYSTTGFVDPSGADVVYFHPAAGRTFSVGVRSGG